MLKIKKVVIAPSSLEYIKSRKLEKQYLKAKAHILMGKGNISDLKKRQPKTSEIWYFRLNKQYRAICELEEDTLYIVAIDNHQN